MDFGARRQLGEAPPLDGWIATAVKWAILLYTLMLVVAQLGLESALEEFRPQFVRLATPVKTQRNRAFPPHAGIIVVHLYGQIPQMGPIVDLCVRRGLILLEDAAQAHGALHGGRRAGSFGRAATFSFYPGKNLGALGDGGAIVTDDVELADRVTVLANHGRGGDHLFHVTPGRNSRLDGLQAGALHLKLPHLDAWNIRRREIHALYRDRFTGTSVISLETAPGTTGVHHLEVIRVPDRAGVQSALQAALIGFGVHYAHPCHQQPAFAAHRPPRALPVAEAAATRQLSIPMHPTLTDEEIIRVAETILAAVDGS